MTIPIRRSRLGIALLFPVVGIRIGGLFVTNASGQQFLNFDVPELVVLILGWLLIFSGAIGILKLIPQMVDPEVGVTWDKQSVRIRAGVGPKREAAWEDIEQAAVTRSFVQSIRIKTSDGPDLFVPVWLLDLPNGWTIETLAEELNR